MLSTSQQITKEDKDVNLLCQSAVSSAAPLYLSLGLREG